MTMFGGDEEEFRHLSPMQQLNRMVEDNLSDESPRTSLVRMIKKSPPVEMAVSATKNAIKDLIDGNHMDSDMVRGIISGAEDLDEDDMDAVCEEVFGFMVASLLLAIVWGHMDMAEAEGIGMFHAKDSTVGGPGFGEMTTSDLFKEIGISAVVKPEDYDCPQCGSPKDPKAWLCTKCRESLS